MRLQNNIVLDMIYYDRLLWVKVYSSFSISLSFTVYQYSRRSKGMTRQNNPIP